MGGSLLEADHSSKSVSYTCLDGRFNSVVSLFSSSTAYLEAATCLLSWNLVVTPEQILWRKINWSLKAFCQRPDRPFDEVSSKAKHPRTQNNNPILCTKSLCPSCAPFFVVGSDKNIAQAHAGKLSPARNIASRLPTRPILPGDLTLKKIQGCGEILQTIVCSRGNIVISYRRATGNVAGKLSDQSPKFERS